MPNLELSAVVDDSSKQASKGSAEEKHTFGLSGTSDHEVAPAHDGGRTWAARKLDTDALAGRHEDQEEATAEKAEDTASFSLETHHIHSNRDNLRIAGPDARRFNHGPLGGGYGPDQGPTFVVHQATLDARRRDLEVVKLAHLKSGDQEASAETGGTFMQPSTPILTKPSTPINVLINKHNLQVQDSERYFRPKRTTQARKKSYLTAGVQHQQRLFGAAALSDEHGGR